MTTIVDYQNNVVAAKTLLEQRNYAPARIILVNYLAMPSNIEKVAGLLFTDTDPRRVFFTRSAPDALTLLDGQLEDTAAAELGVTLAIIEEAQNS